ncbi:MAG TPA: hypothetical protein VGE07_02625, partial [Herpetosiphonaceae bacterium]
WIASAATALSALLGGLIAGWLLPVIELPAPSGPYPVGIVDRELRDPARNRRLMVSVWYPAAASGPPAPLTDHPAEIADGLGAALGVPALAFQHLGYISLAASAGAHGDPLAGAAAGAPFPILVFSHGMTGLRLQSAPMLQELASQGYVVVAIDHTDAAAVTVFPDGEAAFFSLERFGVAGDPGSPGYGRAVDERVFPAWVADQRFVYDTLADWAASDPLLAGKLDIGRIGSLGHSFGGATALEVCRVDPRCRAAVNLDGGLYGAMRSQPATRPLLLMTAEGSADNAAAMAGWEAMVKRAQAPAYWQELPGSNHLSFTFAQLLSPLLAPGDYDPRAGLRTIDRQLRGFFDQHLRGTPGRIFAPQPGAGDVRWRSP